MSTVKQIASLLRRAAGGRTDVDLARATGLARQSIARALRGEQNFNVNTLLALAEATGHQVMIVPRAVARALSDDGLPRVPAIRTMTDDLKDI